MKYYQDETGAVRALEDDGSQDSLINTGWQALTESVALALANPPPTKPQLRADAEIRKVGLISDAAVAIAPLQDAVDLDDATDEEIALLRQWKQYRVALNRLDLSTAPDIQWPDKPAS